MLASRQWQILERYDDLACRETSLICWINYFPSY